MPRGPLKVFWVCQETALVYACGRRQAVSLSDVEIWRLDLSDHFTCAVRGKHHAGLIADLAYRLPDVVWEIPEDQRDRQVRFDTDLCQFGERYFIRSTLFVPFIDASGAFGWGAWAEVTRPVFDRYLDLYDQDGSTEPVSPGTSANRLPAYDPSLGMPLFIQFRDPTTRPSFQLMEEDENRLAIEQRLGIDDARYHEILAALAHG